jgi:ribosomal protein S18 acetylase RimI-like enzyme
VAWKVQPWDAWNVAPERFLVAKVVDNAAAAADLLPYFSAKLLLEKHVMRVLQQIEGKSTKMVGFVQIRPFLTTTMALGDPSSSLHKTVDDSTLYELDSLWVDPLYRRQGIGSRLAQGAVEHHISSKPNAINSIYTLAPMSQTRWWLRTHHHQ